MGRKNRATQRDQAKKRKKQESDEINKLNNAIENMKTNFEKVNASFEKESDKKESTQDQNQTDENEEQTKVKFAQLPISSVTLKGLNSNKFYRMTSIQRASIPHALCGRDVLAAAKTGSGKTLAFLVPILESLYRDRWGNHDGLAALVISPTRELALQIFEVLRGIGKFHNFSAGLVIGGKDQKSEEERIIGINILVCTPGRLLHHLDSTAGFDASSLKILVLDEADRILDMGFQKELNAIVQALPKQRQTLLFSATQTKSIQVLARLSLNNPEYVSVHEQAKYSTPSKLEQNVLFCNIEDKINIVWSFIRTHTNEKSLVFLSSCKQVRFYYETFRLMRPGCPVISLHGKIKQMKRLAIYKDFCEKEGGSVLFATDLASRGLDFKNIDWVIQADCPENSDTYIHRVGRTARYRRAGKSLLLLLPSETKMKEVLDSRRIPLKEIKVNPTRNQEIQGQLRSLLSEDPELKYLAQKALISYVRSVYLNGNKEIFNVAELETDKLSRSYGLLGTPKLKFIAKTRVDKNIPSGVVKAKEYLEQKKQQKKDGEKQQNDEENDVDENDDDDDVLDYDSDSHDSEKEVVSRPRTKDKRLRTRKNQGPLSEHYQKLRDDEDDDDDDNEFLVAKRLNHDIEDSINPKREISKKKKRKLLSENRDAIVTRFDEEGNALSALDAATLNLPENIYENRDTFISAVREDIQKHDKEDYEEQKRLRKEKRRLQKEKERAANKQHEHGAPVIIAPAEPLGDDYVYNPDDFVYSGPPIERGDDSDDYNDDDDDEQQQDYSHSASDSSDHEQKSKKRKFHGKDAPPAKKQKVDTANLSVGEQEDLALRILEGRL